MKKAYYYFLMMILSSIVVSGLYLSTIYSLVYYRVVTRYTVIPFTESAMSPLAWSIVILIGGVIGYHFAKKWWQIIYVDGVYYFDETKKPKSRKKVPESV